MSAEDVFSHLDWQEFLLLDVFQLNLTKGGENQEI